MPQASNDSKPNAPGNASLGELFSDLTRQMSNLVRREVQLAKTEMSQKAANIGKGAGLLVAAAMLGMGGFFALILALIGFVGRALDGNHPLAALIVFGALIILAGLLAMLGLGAIKKTDPVPRETVETLKEDAQWAKEQLR